MQTTLNLEDQRFGPQLSGAFDFTLCFENWILSLLPSILFIIATTFYLAHLLYKPRTTRSGVLLWAKLGTYTILFCIETSKAVHWSLSMEFGTPLAKAASSLVVLSAACSILMSYLHHTRHTKCSSFLSIYFTITILFDIAQTRSYFLRSGLQGVAWLTLTAIIIKALILILEEFAKKSLIVDKLLGESNNRNEIFSGFWNRALLIWLIPTFVQGLNTILQINDLPDLPSEFLSKHLCIEFEQIWDNSKKKTSQFSLPMACLKALGARAYWPIVLRLFVMALLYCQPFLLRETLIAVESPQLSGNIIGGIVGAFALLYFGLAIAQNLFQQLINKKIILLRGFLLSAIYRKLLKLDDSVLRQSTALTLMTTDLAGLEGIMSNIYDAWSSVIGVAVGMYALSIFIGPAVVLIMIPVGMITYILMRISGRMKTTQTTWNERVEDRVAATADALSQMKSIKMSGLNEVFSKSLQELLLREIKAALESRKLAAVAIGLGSGAECLIPIIAIAGGLFWTRTAATGFTVPDIFASLSVVVLVSNPMIQLVNSISQISAVFSCFQRIQNFLVSEEHVDMRECPAIVEESKRIVSLPPDEEDHPQSHTNTTRHVELIEVSTFSFSPEGKQILRNVSAYFDAEKTSIVTGPVGSGKTTLLRLLIGEIEKQRGQILVNPTMLSFCGQTPWLRNISIQDNIISIYRFCPERYQKIIFACNLIEDFSQLRDGDKTMVGSNGCNLSGGQRLRVALARAMYSDKPILVLDDIFSGIDKRTAVSMLQRLFGPGGFLRESRKTVIMSTNSIEHLSIADQVFALDGKGNLERITNIKHWQNANCTVQETGENDEEDDALHGTADNDITTEPTTPEQTPHLEDCGSMNRNRRDMTLYWYYMKTFGMYRLFVFVALAAFTAIMERLPVIFLRIWLSVDPENKRYFGGYLACGLGTIVSVLLMMLFFFTCIMTASYEALHWSLLNKVMTATLAFFSVTDNGQLLNRFSQDMALVSEGLPMNFLKVVFSLFVVLVDIGIISSGATFAPIILPVFIFMLYFLQKLYLRTSRQLRLLDLEAKSPLFTIFTETSHGIQHIRCFQWTTDYMKQAMATLDLSQKSLYAMFYTQQWLRLVLDLAVMIIAVVVVTLALELRSNTPQAAIGMALLSLISFARLVAVNLNQWVEMEASLGAVARLKAFSQSTPSEADPPFTPEQAEALANWPSQGSIEFKNVCAKYNVPGRENREVLKGITLKIRGGQKVAVRGRTGCGKTSLLLSISHLLDYSGSILIDGVELRTIPLKLLRSRITTIPQDCIEIPGSVRTNLYPFEDVTVSPDGLVTKKTRPGDDLMIDVMTRLGIWNHVKDRGGLDANLKTLNLSQGERQLMSLARAMVHHLHTGSKIALMDEVTSHMDYERDGQVQAVMAEVFANCTMIVVAHREQTISDMDTIVEMSEGHILFVTSRKPASVSSSMLTTSS